MEPPNLFGTSGIRGIFSKELSPDFLLKIGLAIARHYGIGSKCIIGWDCRTTSEVIVDLLAGGLASGGVNVIKCGYITTPAFQKYLQHTTDFDFGIMITASHNPPEYNGLKLINRNGLEEYIQVEKEISKIFYKKEFSSVNWRQVGEIKYLNREIIIETYVKSLINVLSTAAKENKFKIVFDFANCVSIIPICEFISRLNNVDPVLINSELRGDFPSRDSEPRPDNLLELSSKVVENNADFGVGFDGDGDRALIVDDKGKIWWGDQYGTLIARYLYHEKGLKSVVTPVTSSSVVDIVLQALHGFRVYRTKVGAKHIVKKMIDIGSKFGFEENGGIIYAPHSYTRDGGIATVLLMNTLAFYSNSLSCLMSNIPKLYQVKQKVYLNNRNMVSLVLKEIEDRYKSENAEVIRIDGLKILWNIDRWVLIRASGTEPVIRVFGEARSIIDAKRIVNEAIKEINEIIND